MNAGLCAVAISYYLGVGNDALKAYELGKRSVEEYPNSVTYNSLGWVCLSPEINRKDIAVGFFEKAIELAEDEELKKDITGNYFFILCFARTNNLKRLKKLCVIWLMNIHAIKIFQIMQNIETARKIRRCIRMGKKGAFYCRG